MARRTPRIKYTRAELLERGVKKCEFYFQEETWLALEELATLRGESRSTILSDLIAREIEQERKKNRLSPY